jgi:hypothetical protein
MFVHVGLKNGVGAVGIAMYVCLFMLITGWIILFDRRFMYYEVSTYITVFANMSPYRDIHHSTSTYFSVFLLGQEPSTEGREGRRSSILYSSLEVV